MEEILKLDPIKKVGGSVDLPGSKSISNRALLLAALSEGTTELQNLLAAEDTEMMIGALEALGVKLEVSDNGTVVKVEGCGGNFPVKKADLFLGNAGTAMRPLSSSLAFSGVARQVQVIEIVRGIHESLVTHHFAVIVDEDIAHDGVYPSFEISIGRILLFVIQSFQGCFLQEVVGFFTVGSKFVCKTQ